MPTFKADFVRYDAQKGEKENLMTLMEQYNDLIKRLSYTVNHLDEENLGSSALHASSEQEESYG